MRCAPVGPASANCLETNTNPDNLRITLDNGTRRSGPPRQHTRAATLSTIVSYTRAD
ncbi:MAG TPA: hypothetical protein VGO91_10550 [Pyrinomonadaceae bacterium]|nr:hypothetical protein [Pyrinomonadaceae bacterium]